jgi:hypothetical protein
MMTQTLLLAAYVLASLSLCFAQPRSLLSSRGKSTCAKKMSDVAPSDVLDLKNWGIALPLSCDCKLKGKRCQLKSGDLSGYQNEYFYAVKDKKTVMITVPAEGHAASSGNGSPRTELKSADPPKGDDKFLPSDSKMHCLSQIMIVHKVCQDDHLTISQMHGDMSDLIKVQYFQGAIRLEMPSPDKTKQTLLKKYTLGQKISTDICTQNGKATFYVNNEPKWTSPKLESKGVVSPGKKGYMVMHAGAYSPGEDGANKAAVMELFSLKLGSRPANGEWTNVTIV